MFLNHQQVTEEVKKIIRNKWQWKHDNSKPMRCSKSSSKREVYSDNNPISRNNNKKYQIDNLTLHLKQLEKEPKKSSKISRRKEIIKILAEINAKEMKQ